MQEKGYSIELISETSIYGKDDAEHSEGICAKEYKITLSYLCMDGSVKSRALKLVAPVKPDPERLPLVFAIHYELLSADPVYYEFLKNGWAVMTPVEIPVDYLFNFVGDNLRFNFAAFHAARRLDFIDPQKIAVRGLSAAGYNTLMLSSTHLGINCASSISGVANISYEFKYIMENNRFNLAYGKEQPPQEEIKPESYPVPAVYQVYNTFNPTGKEIGLEDIESQKWHEYSPVYYLNSLNSPVLFVHSTADMVVPIYQVTEKSAYRETGNDLPEGFKIHPADLIKSSRLNKPYDELLPPGEVETFYMNRRGQKVSSVVEFNPHKKYSINLIDEGEPDRTCNHVRNLEYGAFSDGRFIDFYLDKAAVQTNHLTAEKLEILSLRYEGKLPLFNYGGENEFKFKCPDEVMGSISSDRLDVLLGLLTYTGVYFPQKTDKGLGGEGRKNICNLMDVYNQLDESKRFIDNDSNAENIEFRQDAVDALLQLAIYYSEKCKEEKLCGELEKIRQQYFSRGREQNDVT